MEDKNRLKYFEEVIQELFRETFANELEPIERRNSAIARERYVRSSAKINIKELRKKAKEIYDEVNGELSRIKRPDLDKWNTSIIDDKFIKMCDDEPDKKFVNLAVSKLLWNHSDGINYSKIYKIYKKDWYAPPYWIDIKWICSNCGNQNVIQFAKRSVQNLEDYKCPICGLTLLSRYRFKWEKPISGKVLKDRILEFKEKLLNYRFAHESISSIPEWDLQAQYVSFRRYKDKLPYDIRKFLEYFSQMPKSSELRNDVKLAAKECEVMLDHLEKYELIKQIPVEHPFSNAEEIIDDGLDISTPHRWLKPFKEVDPKKQYDIKVLRFSFLKRVSDEEIILNKYYFDETFAFNSLFQRSKRSNLIKNVFKSKAESRYFKSMKRMIAKDQSIVPNYPVKLIIDLLDDSLKHEFKDDELSYLQRAFFDYVIINDEGWPVKILELQLGQHHKKPKFNKRDLLKKKLCEIAEIGFQEVF